MFQIFINRFVSPDVWIESVMQQMSVFQDPHMVLAVVFGIQYY
jgi:hypothetical protein